MEQLGPSFVTSSSALLAEKSQNTFVHAAKKIRTPSVT
jgi:hypothetical protein